MSATASSRAAPATGGATAQPQPARKQPQDFKFGKVLGEGSFSTVYLAQEISTKLEYAVKVIEKRHLLREKKAAYAKRERDCLAKINHPFFIRLAFTFQDPDKLYFGLTYAKRGELLDYINKLGSFDEKCTQFYTAEIVFALEYLHSIGIIHRDLKPENVLLNEQMHIQISDFGSAKILTSADSEEKDRGDSEDEPTPDKDRKSSFVGTAQYVSPEVLTSKKITCCCDLWAVGCMVFQFVSGQLPFWGGHEYQIFQKILALSYEIPDGFAPHAKDLVDKLLQLEADDRLGSAMEGGYPALKAHPFFEGIEWESLPKQTPPELIPYLPAKYPSEESLWSGLEPGLCEEQIANIHLDGAMTSSTEEESTPKSWLERILPKSEEERKQRLLQQSKENDYHQFVHGRLILLQGFLEKRKGLFARRRMFLLTEGPRFFYVDATAMVCKGEIPWSKELRTEVKKFKVFFIHTPKRTYYLEDPSARATQWCKRLEEVYEYYYGKRPDTTT